jgi:hypothetical protein
MRYRLNLSRGIPWTGILIAAALLMATTAADDANGPSGADSGALVTHRAPSVQHLVDRSAPSAAKPRVAVPSRRFGLDVWEQVPALYLDVVDEAALRAEDAIQAQREGPLPLRNGVARTLSNTVPNRSPDWFELSGIGRLWAAAFVSPDARGLRLHFANVDLPAGAELWVYSPQQVERAQGPFRKAGPFGHGGFWSTVFPGETICVEYFVPEGAADEGQLVVDELMHIYRDLLDPFTDGDGGLRAGDCQLDVMCFPEWHPLHNATARIDTIHNGNSSVCTGTLLNNLLEDMTPYFLTARHCCDDQAEAETAVVYWFYQTEECDGAPPQLGDVPTSEYAYLLATTGTTDFTLLLILGDLPLGLTWAGWDANEVPIGTPVAGIHHPTGSYKRIMFGDTINHPFGQPQSYWGVTWTEGTVEYSSSGSGLYREDTQLYIGQASHSEPPPGCSNPDGPSGYGRFDRIYTHIEDYMVNGFDDVFESNDTCQTACLIYPATYDDRVVKSTSEDWYRISAGPCDRIDIDLMFLHAFGDIDIELWDECGGELVASSTSGDDDESISYENPLGAAHDYYLHVYLASGQLNIYTLTLELTPDVPGPVILEQPQDVTECQGGTAIFSVTASGGGLMYQWRRGNVSLVDDDRINGSQTDTLTISDLQCEDAGDDYNCIVVNLCGVAFSDYATLTVEDCSECPGDVDGDGDTDHADLGALLADWGCSGENCPGDLNDDGTTGHADLGILLADWGCDANP